MSHNSANSPANSPAIHPATSLPLLTHPAGHTVAWVDGKAISREQFLEDLHQVASVLPDHPFAINLCENRYNFLVAFAAVLLKQQTNLLPSSHAVKTVLEVAQTHPDSYCLSDHDISNIQHRQHYLQLPDRNAEISTRSVPHVDASHLACIAFTSGSTGKSAPNAKTWGKLVRVTELIQQSFNIEPQNPVTLVATVPPQHMYGLETSILLPLVSGSSVFAGRPFFPEDIRAALHSQKGPKVLITTPAHLRVCMEAQLDWPAVEFIISATAPMPKDLAEKAEAAFGARVLEIYGCTECGSMAYRRTLDGDIWQLFDTLQIHRDGDDAIATAPYIEEPVILGDIVICHENNRFELAGRKSDMLNIAGKRASLADLNHKLLDIEGVKDGIFYYPDTDTHKLKRLVAFVVAPGLKEKQIVDALRLQIDAAFLPRPVYKLEQLPREKTGKLPRKNLQALLDQLKSHAPTKLN